MFSKSHDLWQGREQNAHLIIKKVVTANLGKAFYPPSRTYLQPSDWPLIGQCCECPESSVDLRKNNSSLAIAGAKCERLNSKINNKNTINKTKRKKHNKKQNETKTKVIVRLNTQYSKRWVYLHQMDDEFALCLAVDNSCDLESQRTCPDTWGRKVSVTQYIRFVIVLNCCIVNKFVCSKINVYYTFVNTP